MEKQLLQEIYNNMEVFKNHGASCSIKQYLAAAAKLHEYDTRISEIFNNEEDTDLDELKQMCCNSKQILENLGIC